MIFTIEALLFALLVFGLRLANYAISTIRLVFIGRDRRMLASVMAFFEAFIFAVVTASVVSDLSNWLNLLAYCFGAAGGSYVGMWLEARFIVSYSTVTIITRHASETIADRLREAGFGVTVTHGEGRDGAVDIIRSSVVNRDVHTLFELVHSISESAFIDVEPIRALSHGWVPGSSARR